MREEEWKRLKERLTKIDEIMREEGFQLVYYNNMGKVVEK